MADKIDGLTELKCYQCGEVPCVIKSRVAMPIMYRVCFNGTLQRWVGSPERVKQKAKRRARNEGDD
jgi:hypothetical protein